MSARPLVVDASVILDLLLRLRDADRIAALVGQPDIRLHAPDTLDREVLNVLRRRVFGGLLDAEIATALVEDFVALPIELYPSRFDALRVWQLRGTVYIGDAYYVTLADRLDCPLVTGDRRLARAAHDLGVATLVP